MRLRDLLFRPAQPIRDAADLADFIDAQSAFVAQKGVYEYSRARAGHYAKVLFREQSFIEAVDRSRWRAYPVALAMVAELVEGALRPDAPNDRLRQTRALAALALAVLDRHPPPAILGKEEWNAERAELARRLQLIGLHPPKRAFEIPEPYAKMYFDLMPIHPKLRASELPTMHNYLKATLCNIHDELTKRMDASAIARALAAIGQETAGTAAGR